MKQEIRIFDINNNLIGRAGSIAMEKRTCYSGKEQQNITLYEAEFDLDSLDEDYEQHLLESDGDVLCKFKIEAYDLIMSEDNEGPPHRKLFCEHNPSECCYSSNNFTYSLRRRKVCYEKICFYILLDTPQKPNYINYNTGDTIYYTIDYGTTTSASGGGYFIYYDNVSGVWTTE